MNIVGFVHISIIIVFYIFFAIEVIILKLEYFQGEVGVIRRIIIMESLSYKGFSEKEIRVGKRKITFLIC